MLIPFFMQLLQDVPSAAPATDQAQRWPRSLDSHSAWACPWCKRSRFPLSHPPREPKPAQGRLSVWFISSFHSQKYHTVGTWLPCHCLNWLEAWKRFIKSSSLEKPRLCHGEVNLRVTRSSLSQKLRVGNQRSKSGCLFTVRQEFQCLYKRNTHQMLEIKPGEPKTTSI